MSIIYMEFVGHVRRISQVGDVDTVLPTIKGRAWIAGEKSIYPNLEGPFVTGLSLYQNRSTWDDFVWDIIVP